MDRVVAADIPPSEDYPEIDGVDVTHLQLDALGLEMHVAMAGPVDGPAILLLTGSPNCGFRGATRFRHWPRRAIEFSHQIFEDTDGHTHR